MKDNKTLEEIKRKIAGKKEFLQQVYGVEEIGVFGSVARGEDTLLSDVDLLFSIEKERKIFSLFDMVDLKLYFEDLLGKSVDVVDKLNIKPFLRDRVLKEAVMI